MFHKQQGFTLIEVIVAFSIFAILILLTVPSTYSLLEKKTEEKILKLFQYDILYLQNKSMANGTQDYLRLELNQDSYTITDTKNELVVRELPHGWEIDPRNLKTISFNHNGTIRFAGTIEILSPKNRYTVTFPIGKGRGYIEKR